MANEESKKSLVDITSDAFDRIIKELSGSAKDGKSKRVIDNLVAFTGAAGGTGTSTIVANLAAVLAREGFTVLVVDMNIQYPIQHAFFNVKQEIYRKDLASFVMGKNIIGESIINTNGISLLCSNNRNIMDFINCDERECSRNFLAAIDKIRYLYDFIFFDCPTQVEFDLVNSVFYKCDALYVVWDESLSCVSNIDRFRRNMQATGIEHKQKTRFIFNKRTNIHYPKSVLSNLDVEVIATLPFDTAVIESGLRANIFCLKGESISKNAKLFAGGIQSLSKQVLEIGGYTG